MLSFCSSRISLGFFDMYSWFMTTAGLRQSERTTLLLTPKQVKNDEGQTVFDMLPERLQQRLG